MAEEAATASARATSGALSVPNATRTPAVMSWATIAVGRIGQASAALGHTWETTHSASPPALYGAGAPMKRFRPGRRTPGRTPWRTHVPRPGPGPLEKT